MKKVSIFNIKGGVAKTTSTANLGACLSQEGKKVLLVDLDPQSNLTKLFKAYSMEGLTVSDVLLDKHLDIHKAIKKTDFENIDILPANIKLTFADRSILIDNTRSQQNRLSKALKNINNEYDYCLIDCPLLYTNTIPTCVGDNFKSLAIISLIFPGTFSPFFFLVLYSSVSLFTCSSFSISVNSLV